MHPERHNKWCMRECERSEFIEAGGRIVVRDFSVRRYNQPWRHADAPRATEIDTGETFRPASADQQGTRP